MSNRTAFRIISLALVLTLFNVPAIYNADAQDPPRPPEPKRPQQQQDSRERKGAQRQGAQADELGTPGEDRIKIDTDMVNLDVTVIDQNNNPVANLKKEDFSVYEDKVKQTIESVSREEVPVSFGLVIDTSGSMRSKLQSVSDAAVLLIKKMPSEISIRAAARRCWTRSSPPPTTRRRKASAAARPWSSSQTVMRRIVRPKRKRCWRRSRPCGGACLSLARNRRWR